MVWNTSQNLWVVLVGKVTSVTVMNICVVSSRIITVFVIFYLPCIFVLLAFCNTAHAISGKIVSCVRLFCACGLFWADHSFHVLSVAIPSVKLPLSQFIIVHVGHVHLYVVLSGRSLIQAIIRLIVSSARLLYLCVALHIYCNANIQARRQGGALGVYAPPQISKM